MPRFMIHGVRILPALVAIIVAAQASASEAIRTEESQPIRIGLFRYDADTPETILDAMRTGEHARLDAIDEAKLAISENPRQINRAKAGRIQKDDKGFDGSGKKRDDRGRMIFRSQEDKQNYILELTEELPNLRLRLNRLENPDKPFVPPLEMSLEQGSFGRHQYGVKIEQVASPTEALASLSFPVESLAASPLKTFTYNKIELVNHSVWISGIDTSKMTDGMAVSIDTPLLVIGTHSFTTVLGAIRTVVELTPVNISRYLVAGTADDGGTADQAK